MFFQIIFKFDEAILGDLIYSMKIETPKRLLE